MIVTMQADASEASTREVADLLAARGFEVHTLTRGGAPVIGVNGRPVPEDLGPSLCQLPGVASVSTPTFPYKLAARQARPEGTVIHVGDIAIGGPEPVIIAGPCVVESGDALLRAAEAVRAAGATMLRGGAYKPRSSPYSFQGLGEEGLHLLAQAREATGLPIVTEVLDVEHLPLVAEYADVLQIGSRNMMNFSLLKAVGRVDRPVLLKRGFAATIEEWLMAAEYILAGGNDQVILCERGIRSFDTSTRFTLDLNAVPLLRELTHLPIVVDPSHGTGRRELVPAMAMAGIAAGAHGLIIEALPDPDSALCDAQQSITISTLATIVARTRAVSTVLQQEPAGVV